jgi:fumarylacetoacetate (FAA) hydrolase
LSEDWGIDLEAEVAVITGDVKMGASAAQSAKSVRLLMLVNDVSLRNLIPAELAKGFGFFQSKPALPSARWRSRPMNWEPTGWRAGCIGL